MALTTEDRQEIRQTIQDAVTSSVAPLVQRVSGLETRLYGRDRAAGDVGDLKQNVNSLFKRVNRTEVLVYLLAGSVGTTGGIFGLVKWLAG